MTKMLLLQALGSIATAILALLVVYRDVLYSFIRGPFLILELAEKVYAIGKEATRDVYYYYVRVINRNPLSPARSCRVLLTKEEVEDLDDCSQSHWVQQPYGSGHQLTWSPEDKEKLNEPRTVGQEWGTL